MKQGKLKLANSETGGYLTNKLNAFTLIELLAIIVILAIIAVITVPIILNVIDNARKGAAIDSAYGYKDAVQKFYISKSVNDPTAVPATAKKSVNDLKIDGLLISGQEPSEGWVELEKGQVVAYSLKFDDYTVTKYKDTESTAVKNGEIAAESIDTTIFDSLEIEPSSDGAKYLKDAIEVYYNPVSGATNCNGQEGCMHWYLYSVKGDYANMMLDHNITDAGAASGVWASSSDYSAGLTEKDGGGYQTGEGESSKATSAGITYPNTVTSFPAYDTSYGANYRGPVTALNTLKSLTSAWTTGTPKVPNSTSTNEHIIPSSDNDNKYQIDYTGYHARLITIEEAGYLGCTTLLNSCPTWMIKGTTGENSTTYANINGYWTSSQFDGTSDYAWYVRSNACLYWITVLDANRGVRPVITVSTSDVL